MISHHVFYALFPFILEQLVFIKSNHPLPPNPDDPIFTIKYLIKLKRPAVHRPYRKFGLTYDKFSVCELRYNQKWSVCNAVYSSKKFNFQMVPLEKEYPDLSCQRRWIDLNEVAQVADTGRLSLSMYECPNPYKIEKRYRDKAIEEVKFFVPVHFLLTGGYFGNSVILGYKHAGTRPLPVKFHTVFLGVLSLKERRRLYFENRNEIYEQQTELRKFSKRTVGRAVGREDPIQRFQHTADSKIISNGQFIRKPTYLKFKSTYKNVNICAMTEEKKLKLCQQVFESKPYPLRVSKSKTGAKFRCIRREAILLYTFVQVYSAKIPSIKCPIRSELTANSFYLASTLEVPGMIALMQIPPFVEMLPDAFIGGLNSEGLIKKPEPVATPVRGALQKPAPITSSVRGSPQNPTPSTRSVTRKKERPHIKR